MNGRDWRGLELAVTRLLGHCGWRSVQDVGERGDKGADIISVRDNANGEPETYLFQVKSIAGNKYVGCDALDQALQGQAHYGAKIVIVVTNGEFTKFFLL